jgi:hypothetical protein
MPDVPPAEFCFVLGLNYLFRPDLTGNYLNSIDHTEELFIFSIECRTGGFGDHLSAAMSGKSLFHLSRRFRQRYTPI